MQYCARPCNTMQYHAIPCSTMQYHASWIIADSTQLTISLSPGSFFQTIHNTSDCCKNNYKKLFFTIFFPLSAHYLPFSHIFLSSFAINALSPDNMCNQNKKTLIAHCFTIWLGCYCSRKLSIMEVRFSKWF